MKYFRIFIILTLLCALILEGHTKRPPLLVGAYYFGGWAGHRSSSAAIAEYPDAPRNLTPKLYTDFSGRQPIWGWRDDDLSIMERQIDLAADNGIDMFVFCWYFADSNEDINIEKIQNNSLHTSIQLFMKAKNKHRMKFAVLIANHQGFEIIGKERWLQTVQFLSDNYFHDPQYLKIDGRPLIQIFSPAPAHEFFGDMRDEARQKGWKDLYIYSCFKFYSDADMNGWYNIIEPSAKTSEKRSYDTLVKYVEKAWRWSFNTNVVPIVMAGWDKRPWEKKEASIYYTRGTAKQFGNHFERALDCIETSHPKVPLVMIYAWNELGEGGYLVPTRDDPKAKYLKQIKQIRKRRNL